MNRNDVIDVLSAVTAADRRTVGDSDIEIWCAVIGDLDKVEVLEELIAFLREKPGVWLEPGHLRARVRARRRDTLEREDAAARKAREAALDRRPGLEPVSGLPSGFGDAFALPPGTSGREFVRRSLEGPNPLMVRCTYCGAGVGFSCVVFGTREPLTRSRAHPCRIEAAAAGLAS